MYSKRFIKIFIALFTISILSSCKKEVLNFQWQQLTSPTTSDLNSVVFLNSDTGFVVGGQRYSTSEIYKTIDGGHSWHRMDDFAGKELYTIIALNKDTLFTAGYDGKIERSYDGGENWSLYQSYLWKPVRCMQFLSANQGVEVGGVGYRGGHIGFTFDYGNDWIEDTLINELRGVYMVDDSVGYACGYGYACKTIDGARTWKPLGVDGDFFFSLYFSDEDHGIIVGNQGTIKTTSDGGLTWNTQRNGNDIFLPKYNFEKIRMRDSQSGYLVGDGGLMMKTLDGGEQWFKINAPDADIRDIYLLPGGGILCCAEGKVYRFFDD